MAVKLKRLSSQVIVLTGATSGIGLATARMAARRGAKLVLVARNDQALQQLVEELQHTGTSAIGVTADVGKEEDVKIVAKTAIDHFGRIDTWVNNAGVSIFGRHLEVAMEDNRRLFETNFWGVVYSSLEAIKHMRSHGGALINVGSGFSDQAAPLQGMYSASKHAVKGFTDSLRVELSEARLPVSVTLIKPSSVNTMLTEHARNYLEVRPALPPPVYAPDIVGKAILYAAEHPERDIYVGGAAKLLGLSSPIAPRLVDKVMKLLLFGLQKTRTPADPYQSHNLYSPSDGDLKECSHMDRHVFQRNWYTNLRMHPMARKAFLGLTMLAAAGLWQARRR